MRAIDSRVVVGAWRRGGADSAESPHRLRALAGQLGAARVVVGAVVGRPDRLVVTASLLDPATGATEATASVSGTHDGLAGLADQLALQLLARDDRVPGERLRRLARHPLGAVRAYLDGRAAYRRGRYDEAVRHFGAALEIDSTLTFAALDAVLAAGWTGASTERRRAERLAWAGRADLSEPDRALLLATVGPTYPVSPPHRVRLAAWERAAALAPDRPEIWFAVGDDYMHKGNLLGAPDALQRAEEAFGRALRSDSTFVPALEHLLQLAAHRGDTAAVRRLAPRFFAAAPTELADFMRWRIALLTGDRSALEAIRARFQSLPPLDLRWIGIASQEDGVALGDGERALQIAVRRAASTSERLNALAGVHAIQVNRGHLAAALRTLDVMRDTDPSRHEHLWYRVLDALYAGGSRAAAEEATRALDASAAAPPAADTGARHVQLKDLCAAAHWRASSGDLDAAARAAEQLRRAASAGGPADATWCAALLDATVAAARRAPDLAARIELLDSLTAYGDPLREWVYVAPIDMARWWEQLGDARRAHAASRRHHTFGRWPLYLTPALREEGRLAALAGDRAGAASAYRRYLALRDQPDPSLRPQADSIRDVLSSLR